MLCTKSYLSHRNFAKFLGKHQLLNPCRSRENIFDSLQQRPGAQIILLYGLPSCARSWQAIPAKLQVAGQQRNTKTYTQIQNINN